MARPLLGASASSDILESAPPQYQLRIVSGLPKGSSCSRFNGYEVTRRDANKIEVAITHHEVADRFVACTARLPLGGNGRPARLRLRAGR